jgi:hypothetical protein
LLSSLFAPSLERLVELDVEPGFCSFPVFVPEGLAPV